MVCKQEFLYLQVVFVLCLEATEGTLVSDVTMLYHVRAQPLGPAQYCHSAYCA